MKRRDFLEQTSSLGAVAALGTLGSTVLRPELAVAAADKPEPGRWPFGLSAAEEKRAAKLHHDSIIVDMEHQGAGGMNIYDHYDPALLAKYIDPKLHGLEAVGQTGWIPYQLAMDGKSDLIKT